MKKKIKLSLFLLTLFLIFIAVNSTTYAADLPNTVITYMERGQAVREVQSALNDAGYHLATDGIYGPATRSAVLDFQQKYSNLANDGNYGPNTASVLEDVLNETSSSKLPNTTLTYLERGANVRLVQKSLNKVGYNLAVDGIYGSRTKRAVLDFQSKYSHLSNDGIYGPNTKLQLEKALKNNSDNNHNLPNTSLTYMQRGQAVREVQSALNRTGYNLVTDGIYGPATRNAVLDFQQKYSNLANDGIYGPNTRAVLINAIKNGDASGKIAYLTFDDGPSKTVTPDILNILEDYDIKATFFVLGNMAEKSPDILRQIEAEGHSIGNHTYSHDYDYVYASMDNFLGELNKTKNILKDILGNNFDTELLRFPGGSFEDYKNPYKNAARDRGYRIYDWNALNGDSEAQDVPVSKLISRLKETVNGEEELIVLMHDAYGKETTARALPNIIEYLQGQGYSFRALRE